MVLPETLRAGEGADGAVQFDHFQRPCLVMKPVDVLCEDRHVVPRPLEISQREMRGVGLCVEDPHRQRAEPLEEFFRERPECIERGGFQRFIA